MYHYICKVFLFFDDTSKIRLIIFNKTFPQNILLFGLKFITLPPSLYNSPKETTETEWVITRNVLINVKMCSLKYW